MNIEDFYKALYKMRDLPDHPDIKAKFLDNSPLTFACDVSFEQYVGLEVELHLMWQSY